MRYWKRLSFRWRYIAAASLLAMLVAPAATDAHLYTHLYDLRRADPCVTNSANRYDPVGVIFYNDATAERVHDEIDRHVGWNRPFAGTPGGDTYVHYAKTHGSCYRQNFQVIEDFWLRSRHHARLYDNRHSDPRWGDTWVATPHYDQRVIELGCTGHYVPRTGYNDSKYRMAADFQADGHEILWKFKGNTRGIVQPCTSARSSSDGFVAYIELREGMHGPGT